MFDGGDDAFVRGHRPGTRGSGAMNAYLSRIVTTMAEMEQGRRPVAALDAIASPLAARRIRHQVHAAQVAPRPGRARRRRRTAPTVIRSAQSFHPSAGVTEGVVVVECEERSRAYCVRLEQEGDRWRLVELATPGGQLRAAVTEASRTGALPRDEHGRPRSSGRGGISYSAPGSPPWGDTAARETRARMRAARDQKHGGQVSGEPGTDASTGRRDAPGGTTPPATEPDAGS